MIARCEDNADLDELLPVTPREHRLVCAATACTALTPAAWMWDTATGLLLAGLLLVLMTLVGQSVLRPDP
ncbi:MAG: hypothetical protein JWN08_861 [Frankiales bacterium]|nr:hypothetical protein [Frankiales bacterium]